MLEAKIHFGQKSQTKYEKLNERFVQKVRVVTPIGYVLDVVMEYTTSTTICLSNLSFGVVIVLVVIVVNVQINK